MRVLCLFIGGILLSGCQRGHWGTAHDGYQSLHRHDYEAILETPKAPSVSSDPILESIHSKETKDPFIVEQSSLPAEFLTLVSIEITDQVPIQEALWILARQANVNISLASDIHGSLAYKVEQQPFFQAIENLCALAQLRYRFQGEVLRIEPDTPYLATYDIQFLTFNRQSKSKMSVSTDTFNGIGGNGITPSSGGETNNGSQSIVTIDTKSDFWQEIEKNIEILIDILPEAHESKGIQPRTSYAIHKQGGLITVRATAAQHRLIEQYLQRLYQTVSAQVLIEAKILEVNLRDDFRSGINWHYLNHKLKKLSSPLGSLTPLNTKNHNNDRDIFTMAFHQKDLSAIIDFMENFGTARTLSSPRLTVLNNQSAIMKVAKNQVYFSMDYQEHTPSLYLKENESMFKDITPTHRTVHSKIQTIPIGLIMVVHPAVNLETNDITMTLRPTISTLSGFAHDPAIDLIANREGIPPSLVPIIDVRELDSVLRIPDGQVMIMGGLMQERVKNQEVGFPKEISLLHHLFGSKEEEREVIELVIFLRATIVRAPIIPLADQRLYTTFFKDPRKISL